MSHGIIHNFHNSKHHILSQQNWTLSASPFRYPTYQLLVYFISDPQLLFGQGYGAEGLPGDCFHVDTKYASSGYIYKQGGVDTKEQCLDLCNYGNTSMGCEAWEYVVKENRCILKAISHGGLVNHTGYISGPRHCHAINGDDYEGML